MEIMKISEKIIDYVLSGKINDNPILNEKQKIVMKKKIIENLNFNQIAREIDRSPTQVKNLLNQGLRLLNLYFKEKAPCLLIKDSLLSERIKNAFFEDESIKCLKDFHNLPYNYVFRRNLGKESINEIQNYIQELGFSLKFPDESIKILDKSFKKDLFNDWTNQEINHWIFNLSKLLKEKL